MESLDLNGGRWYALKVNPEPWKVGPLSVGRRNGKVFPTIGPDPQLVAYQETIREEFGTGHRMLEGNLRVMFYFWRRLSAYRTQSGKMHRKHQSDATNMQKATEDALQGILFKNDRDNVFVSSIVMAQGPDVTGMVVIHIEAAPIDFVDQLPPAVWHMAANLRDKKEELGDNTYDTEDTF
jgi:Holliday junction resolvase RusA-like endonuclease